ncbi:MAG: hypothetical protein JXQ23_09220 [Clostridia bacterium]|nr:hypothetical protein [Clostridia bacterium]
MATSESDQKLMGVLCYLWILWLIPLLTEHKNDPYIKFHINQGIVLSIVSVIVGILSWIPVIGWLLGIGVFVLTVLGIINAVQLQEKPLPLIGGIQIYK